MEFFVSRNDEMSHVPRAYFDEHPTEVRIFEPAKVTYDLIMSEMRDTFGCKLGAELYYFLPGSAWKLPEGMFLIAGPDDVEKMLSDLNGSKKCHLYIVYNRTTGPHPEHDFDLEVQILHVTCI